MNEQLKKYIMDLGEKNKRIDGRSLLDLRKPIKIEYGVSKNAEGSATVTIGKTIVSCGVKLATGEPYPDKPDEGSLIVTAELAALASPDFEPGPPNEVAIELARIVDRGIRESGAIDTKKLCIRKGELVWLAFIDIYIQNHDGNLIDASALAAIAALMQAKIPKIDKDDKIEYGVLTKVSVPIIHQPIACTFGKIGNLIVYDVTAEEEKVLDARITITSDEKGIINGMQKGGTVGLSVEEIEKCIEIALQKAKELRKFLKKG